VKTENLLIRADNGQYGKCRKKKQWKGKMHLRLDSPKKICIFCNFRNYVLNQQSNIFLNKKLTTPSPHCKATSLANNFTLKNANEKRSYTNCPSPRNGKLKCTHIIHYIKPQSTHKMESKRLAIVRKAKKVFQTKLSQ